MLRGIDRCSIKQQPQIYNCKTTSFETDQRILKLQGPLKKPSHSLGEEDSLEWTKIEERCCTKLMSSYHIYLKLLYRENVTHHAFLPNNPKSPPNLMTASRCYLPVVTDTVPEPFPWFDPRAFIFFVNFSNCRGVVMGFLNLVFSFTFRSHIFH